MKQQDRDEYDKVHDDPHLHQALRTRRTRLDSMKDTRRATFCSRSELPLGTAVSGSRRIRRSRNASHAGECIITHSQTTPSLACSSSYKSARIRDGALRLRPFSSLGRRMYRERNASVAREGISIFVSDVSLKSALSVRRERRTRMFGIFKRFSKVSRKLAKGLK